MVRQLFSQVTCWICSWIIKPVSFQMSRFNISQYLLSCWPMVSITGEPCVKEVPVLQLVVSKDSDVIIQAAPGGCGCCSTENRWAVGILLWPSVHLLLRDSCEQYKPWLILSCPVFCLCCEPLYPSTGLYLFSLVELSSYGSGKIYVFTVLISTVCYHMLWVWVVVCVSVCTYVYMYISHSRPVMPLFGGKATSTIKVSSKTACGFLNCWVGVGSPCKTQKETLSLLCT